jgi:Ca2+-binding EF-hand superfamily protein
MADFDHDGVVEPNEIRQLKQELHKCFDIDESGSIDTKEIERVRFCFSIFIERPSI